MPYILLALLGLIPATWVMVRRREAALLATLFVAMALVDLADWVAYSILGLYVYNPQLSSNPVVDETLGVILAEFIFVGSLTVLFVGHKPGWVWSALGAALVTVIQEAFTRRGLLVLHGWTPWLNAAGFLIYFWLMQTYHAAVQRNGLQNGWLRMIGQAGVVTTFGALAALVTKTADASVIYLAILSTESTNQSLGRLLLQWGVVVPLGLWVLRAHWSNAAGRVAVATTAGTVFTYMRVALGFQSFHAPYSPLSDGLLLGVTLIAAVLVDAWIRDWEEAQALVT